jgi:alpha-tubulin suppressor-like RCC1 family protein
MHAPKAIHRRLSRCAVAAMAIWVSGLVILEACPAGANPTASNVDHWGGFFGDKEPGTHDHLEIPTSISLPGKVTEVATSNSTEYALMSNGTVYAWGQGDRGQLGNGGTVNSFTTAVQVDFPAGVTISSLPTDAMPYDTAMAVDTLGRVWGWGLNSAGQLCMGTVAQQDLPVELPLSDVTAVAGAGDHALYDSAGTVYACGGNHNGDLGDGSTTLSATPVKVVGLPSTGVVTLVAAFEDSGALTSTGAYYDWGLNSAGQLGAGSLNASSIPVLVNLPHAVSLVVQGGSIGVNGQTLVRLTNGTLWAWGDDAYGQLGDGGTSPYQASPVRITLPSGVHFVTLATGGQTSYGITPGGNVYGWGDNSSGQVGSGSGSAAVTTPLLVDAGAILISATANNVAVGR